MIVRQVLVIVLALWPASLSSQVVLAGFVREDSTEVPIPGVEVVIEGTSRRAMTDARGKFILDALPRGDRVALFRLPGWRPVRLHVSLVVGDTVWSEALMVKSTVQLAPVEVTAAKNAGLSLRDGFEDRRKLGFGRFLDSTALRSSEHLGVPDLLRRIDGINVVRRGASMFAMSYRRDQCFMQVVLDGHVIYRPFAPTAGDTVTHPPVDFAKEFDVTALESIEVYRSAAETPGEFSGPGAACGTVVLWSRRL